VKIGIIGAGAVGTAIAKYALLTGHQMALASRRRDKLAETVTALGNGASVATISDAAAADIVILAVPWPAREETLSAILTGRKDPGRRDQPIRTDVTETRACRFRRSWVKRDYRGARSWRPCCEGLQSNHNDAFCRRPKTW
jgi:NADP oxidoreductase coenzyme F420-dependent